MRSRTRGCLSLIASVTCSYIQNLPSDTTEDLLYDVFKRYGIIQQNMNGTPRVRVKWRVNRR